MKNFVEIPEPSRFRIGSFFQENSFLVPMYQRNYSWTNDEITDFWNDLNDIINESRSNHFFGQVVTFKNSDDIQEIIDGQQRITTSALFLAALRDIANNMYKEKQDVLSEDAGDDLRDIRRTVKKYLRGENGNRAALIVEQGNTPGDATLIQDVFNKLTTGHVESVKERKDLTEPMRNLLNAYVSIKNSIIKKMQTKKTLVEQVGMLQTICDSFVEHFYIVMISAPDQQDAFIIFETLNSRGKDLKASDIIKNHLMYLMSEDLSTANREWSEISHALKDDSSRITRFIRTYWAAKNKLVSEKVLYRSLSDSLKTENEAREFLSDLIELVPLYDVLENPTANKKNASYFENKMLNKQINVLDKMHVLLYYPIVLALKKRKYSEQNMAIVVNKVLSVFVRHRTIMNEGTNKLETGFADIAQKIYFNDLSKVEEINKEMDRKLLKNNFEIETKLQILSKEGGLRGPKKWTLVYLISEIYDDLFEDTNYYDETFLNDRFKVIQIGNVNDGINEEFINYLGNWTIIEDKSKFDTEDSLENRIKLLKGSKLEANQELA
jgi:uncharacterized protein with ParB-like and HNH nuclease domain